jgi:uncharacterized protein (TIGR02265 family)
MDRRPTIKGIYVNSHVRAVQKKRGPEGLKTVEACFGRPLKFHNSENIPVRDEVKLLECSLSVMRERPVPESEKEYQAGRLHFDNFVDTPMAKIIFSVFRKNFKMLAMKAENIAGHVFEGVKFTSTDLGPNSVKVVTENNDYPLAHFRGFFQCWIEFAGLEGQVNASEISPNVYEYLITWT